MISKQIWVKSTKSSANNTEIKILRKFAWEEAENQYKFMDFFFETKPGFMTPSNCQQRVIKGKRKLSA